MLKYLLSLSILSVINSQENWFALNILHYNDFHARFVETSPTGTVCNPEIAPCIGGFARLTKAIREAIDREPESVLLNGGDSFQGTIWYNILRWNVTQEFMNMLPHDAHVLGNHEFDNGISGVVPYLENLNAPVVTANIIDDDEPSIQGNHEFDNGISGVVPYLENLNAPVVTANIIDDDEPSIQGLYKPSIIIEREGRQIGIIGVIIASTKELASTGRLEFKDEVETVREEAEKLSNQEVNIIIVLSHCGIDIDREIAAKGGPHIDIIVGGHSHTLLYNGDVPVNTTYVPQGPYPVVIHQDERSVLIVQAAAHTEYLGEIKLYFDDDGNLLDWYGHPHYIGNEIEQAQDVLDKINEYLPLIDEFAKAEIGSSMVYLTSACSCGECNLGSLLCEAYLDSVLERASNNNWHYAHFCVINTGGIRTSIDTGVITVESMMLATPFENNIEAFELRGDHILQMLEYAAANDPWSGARMVQTAGLQVVIDGSRPAYNRVVNATIRCIECDVPKYEPLQVDKNYRVVAQNFLGEGGDGFTMVSNNRFNVEVIGVDYVISTDYIIKHSPIFSDIDGRIQISNPCAD